MCLLVVRWWLSYFFGCFFFKQKTAYEMRISDWSSYVCSSDLPLLRRRRGHRGRAYARPWSCRRHRGRHSQPTPGLPRRDVTAVRLLQGRSEEHTSELQSLMRISYAVFCLKKKNKSKLAHHHTHQSTQHRAKNKT